MYFRSIAMAKESGKLGNGKADGIPSCTAVSHTDEKPSPPEGVQIAVTEQKLIEGPATIDEDSELVKSGKKVMVLSKLFRNGIRMMPTHDYSRRHGVTHGVNLEKVCQRRLAK